MGDLLLLSNSTNYKEDYMRWCASTIASFVKGRSEKIVFVPYAAVGFSYESYTDKVNEALESFGVEVANLDLADDKAKLIEEATCIFVGGGNTFHLLKTLYDEGVVETISRNVNAGTAYVGWSAGSNLAGPTICTTNDMPIVFPPSFAALDLVPFQINPHYTEKTIANHGGESREKRLEEYLAANINENVACLPEGTYVKVKNGNANFYGDVEGVVLSKKNKMSLKNGDSL